MKTIPAAPVNVSFLRHLFRTVPLAVFLLLTAVGCGTLPNVSHFSDVTTQLNGLVRTAGAATVAEVAAAEQGMTKRAPGGGLSNAVAQGWQPALKAAKALADYSDSLRALVESGQNGEAEAKAATAALKPLVETAVSAFPAGAVGGEVLDGLLLAGEKIYGAIAKEIAARSLAKAISNSDPLIQQVAARLSAGFSGMSQILESSDLTLEHHLMTKYQAQKKYLNAYEQERDALLTRTLDQDNHVTGDTNLLARWQWVEKLIEAEHQKDWYKDYMAEKLSIQTRLEAEREIVRKAPALLTAWAASHKELVKAVQQKGTPDFTELLTLSRDLFETYQQTKARVEAVKAQTLKNKL